MARTAIRADLELHSTAFSAGLIQAEGLAKKFARSVAGLGVVSLVVNAGGLVAATDIVAGYEDEIAKVRALTAATADQFTALNAEAQNLGANTRFSAREAASGMAFLAQAGFKANEIISETKNVLNLAAAGALELADAADIASNVFTPFQQSGAQFTTVVDVLAKTASVSNTNVSQLGEAMASVAPVAAQLGRDIQETAAAIGVLGNSGIQAEEAGTALRNIFLRLVNPTSEVREGMKTLGLSFEDLDPSSKTLVEAFTRVKEAQENLANNAKATQAISQIFGVRATAAAGILASSVSDIEKFTKANREAGGEAERMATIMSDSLGGAIDSLKSRFQAVVLTINSSEMGPAFRSLIEDITGSLADFNASDAAALGDRLAEGLRTAQAAAAPFIDAAKSVISLVGNLVDAFNQNRETIAAWAEGLIKAYAAFKAFQFGKFIAGTVTSTAKTLINSAATAKATITQNALALAYGRVSAAATASGTAQGVAAAASVAAAAKGGAAAAAVSSGSLLVPFGQLSKGLQSQVRGIIATTTAGGAAAGKGFISKLASSLGNAGVAVLGTSGKSFLGALTAIGSRAIGIIGAWQLGKAIGKQLDEAFKISDYLVENVIGKLNGVTGQLETFAKPLEAISLRVALGEAQTLADETAARAAITDRIYEVESEIATLHNQGIKDADAEITTRRQELQILENTIKNADKLARGISDRNRMERAAATASSREAALLKKVADEVASRKAAAASVETFRREEEERARRIADLAGKIVDANAASAREARAVAEELVNLPVSDKTSQEAAKARAEHEESLRLLRAQAGVKLNLDAPVNALKDVLTRLSGTEIKDDALVAQIREIDRLVNSLDFGAMDASELERQFARVQQLASAVAGTQYRAPGLIEDVNAVKATMARLAESAATLKVGDAEGLTRLEATFDIISKKAASIRLDDTNAAALSEAVERIREALSQAKLGDLGGEDLARVVRESKRTLSEMELPQGVLDDAEKLKSIVDTIALNLGPAVSPDDITRARELKELATEIFSSGAATTAEAALDAAREELGLRQQMADAETAGLQNEGRASIAQQIAEAEASLTATLADDTAVQIEARRLQIVKELSDTYKLSGEESLQLAEKLLDKEKEIAAQKQAENRQNLADRFRLARAESGASGEDPAALKQQLELRDLTRQIVEEQGYGWNKALGIAREILSNEKLAQNLREKGTLELAKQTTEKIRKVPFSTGGVGSGRQVGTRSGAIFPAGTFTRGLAGAGKEIANQFTRGTKPFVNDLGKSAEVQKQAAFTTRSFWTRDGIAIEAVPVKPAEDRTQSAAIQAATAAAQAANNATSVPSAQDVATRPLQVLVGIMQAVQENTLNTVTELKLLRDMIGVSS